MAQKLRIVGPASDLQPGNDTCTCCDRKLNGQVAWLELDQRDDTYHDHGGVPPEKSQGWFPFGMTCARKINGKRRAWLAA